MKDTEVLPDISTLPGIFGALYISLLLWWKGDIIQMYASNLKDGTITAPADLLAREKVPV